MIDTHAHLNFPELQEDLSGVLARASEVGVSGYVIPGTGYETSVSGLDLARAHSSIWAGVGVHPTDNESSEDRSMIEALLPDPKVVAIGEVGLDYYHLPSEESERERLKKVQHERFIWYAGLAKKHGLPLIIHSRDCFEDMYALLKEHAPGQSFVIHCFTGGLQEANAWLDLGGTLSFTAIITYPKNTELREVVAHVPNNRFMIETDAPFLPPAGHRGEICEPKFVRTVAECIAEAKGLSFEQVDEYTTATATTFFKIRG
jgi:TatD DNase family protein